MKANAESGRQRGLDAGIAMVRRLERSAKLTTACDPGWDVPSTAKPMRNIVLEVLDGLHGNRAAVEGFALVLSGYAATSAAGCAISAREMRTQFRRRDAAALRAA